MMDIMWPLVLVLVYTLLFAIVLFLTWRFTRDSDHGEPVTEPPAPEAHDASGNR